MTGTDRKTLLVVDDEKEITSSLVALFRRTYRVLPANDAAAALAILAEEPVDVLMTDQKMPGTSGTEMLEEVSVSHPEVIRILLTGYADIQAAIDAINKGQVYRYLTKPWNPEELMTTVRQAVERREMISERARLVTELQAANAELREIDRLRSAFIEVVGHELKTPLTVLLGYVHLIEIESYIPTPPELKPVVTNLRRTVGHLNDIVLRTLKLLKADFKNGTMQWAMFPPIEALVEARSMVELFLSLRRQKLVIKDRSNGVPVRADRYKLADILVNLLTNAIKFSQDGQEIVVTIEPDEKGFIVFEVADSGTGIPEDDLPRVFDRFFASFDVGHHSSGKYQFGRRGVGLGLSIVKRFVDLHGGTLTLDSKSGAGTRVRFTLQGGAENA